MSIHAHEENVVHVEDEVDCQIVMVSQLRLTIKVARLSYVPGDDANAATIFPNCNPEVPAKPKEWIEFINNCHHCSI